MTCKQCGGPIVRCIRGRRRVFCSHACLRQWHYDQQDLKPEQIEAIFAKAKARIRRERLAER